MPKLQRDKNPATQRIPYSNLWWNGKAQRYVAPNGRFISPDVVRDIIDDNLDKAESRLVRMAAPIKDAAAQLQAGEITHDEYILAVKGWRDAIAEQINGIHTAQGMAAVGGFHAMTDEHKQFISGAIDNQLQYLNIFAAQSAMYPDYVQTDGFDERSKMYAQAGRGTYEQMAAIDHIQNGFIYIKNILEQGAHHCTGQDSCIEMTNMGKVFADDPLYLLPGFRKCKTKCKCKSKRTKE